MVNTMGLIIGVVAYLAVTFVLSNFLLQKEFDVVSALVNLATVLVALWIGGFVVKKGLGRDSKPKVQL